MNKRQHKTLTKNTIKFRVSNIVVMNQLCMEFMKSPKPFFHSKRVSGGLGNGFPHENDMRNCVCTIVKEKKGTKRAHFKSQHVVLSAMIHFALTLAVNIKVQIICFVGYLCIHESSLSFALRRYKTSRAHPFNSNEITRNSEKYHLRGIYYYYLIELCISIKPQHFIISLSFIRNPKEKQCSAGFLHSCTLFCNVARLNGTRKFWKSQFFCRILWNMQDGNIFMLDVGSLQ